MNELISLAELTLQNLSQLLKSELGEHRIVAEFGNHILISISRADFEQHLGSLLQQIYKTVDQHFPVREEQLSVIIRDLEEKYENTFKIWPTA